ncbi:hypothetical protein TFLX_03098 [Thermoflexales bacterium]|nr:hypothetical protein TFLX_03098 [Thermoflexales bacterium]
MPKRLKRNLVTLEFDGLTRDRQQELLRYAQRILSYQVDTNQRLVFTLRPLTFIARRAAIADKRVFLEQIVVGVYRVVDDKATVFVSHTLDRAVVKAGHDPKSTGGRLHRQKVAKRITFAAMAFNVACALINPSALPLLAAYAVIWPWYLWRSDVERKSIMLQQGTS